MRLMAMLGFAMRHIPGIDRSQVLLLPEAVDDYVGRDNPVRFIDAFVDGLDLAAAGFERATPKATGRPGYDPADLLKLYIYGYLNRVRSSRRLEAESKRNLEVIWLLRRLSPDFKTIADFRRINRAAFRQVFREFVRLCRELELFGRELVAVDGTRIKAVNSRKRNFTKAKLAKALAESDERLSRYLDRLDEADGQDDDGLCCKLGEGAMRDQGASCSPYDSALARRSCSHAMASVRAHGPRPKARSTIRASPTMPPWRANIPAWPLRSARITSKPLIVA